MQPRRREDELKPPAQRELLAPMGVQPHKALVVLDPKAAHALHPGSLLEVDGSPARLEPGDQLVLKVTQSTQADKPLDTDKFCVLTLRLTDLPSLAPPPSVYSLVTALPDFRSARVALHACGPLPDVVEYPGLLEDLRRGMVQRRALFVWHWSSVEERPGWATLVKVDRSGGAQLPRDAGDFVQVPASGVEERDFVDAIEGGPPPADAN